MNIEHEIELIKERNKKVEADKAWEVSWTRKFLILSITYLLIVLFMYVAKIDRPFIGAIIPAVAYLISMSALPYVKKVWIKKNRK